MDLKNVPERSKDESSNAKDSMQILEEALTLCKFGKFHLRLLAATFCSTVAVVLVTTTTSYIVPMAECDLKMNIMDKGILIAMPHLGQIVSSPFAGFLTDAFGRKKFLVYGNAILFIGTIIEGLSQTYFTLIFAKILEGIAFSFCFSAIPINLTELCHLSVRDRLLLIYSSFISVGLIIAALLAWAILPIQFNYSVLSGYFEIHSWNIYLYVCSLWSLSAFILYLSLPESPKYLLSHGRENEALEILRTIYSKNSGEKKDTFPILSFNLSGIIKQTKETTLRRQIVKGLFETKELFRKPLVFKLLMFSFMIFIVMIILSSLVLWFPQLSTIIENHNIENRESAIFCIMINDYIQELKTLSITTNGTDSYECVPKLSGQETYMNGVILGVAAVISVGISASLVDYIGQKILMFVILILSAIFLIVLYWTNSSLQIAILLSSTSALMQTTLSLQQNISTRYFPTALRSLAVSIILMIGHVGGLIGTIIFPILLEISCMAPFAFSALMAIGIAGLVYFIPNVAKNNRIAGDK